MTHLLLHLLHLLLLLPALLRLAVVGERAESHLDRLLRAVLMDQRDVDRGARLLLRDGVAQRAIVSGIDARDRGDHVARGETGELARTARLHPGDRYAFGRAELRFTREL